jgi:hypothetical protein
MRLAKPVGSAPHRRLNFLDIVTPGTIRRLFVLRGIRAGGRGMIAMPGPQGQRMADVVIFSVRIALPTFAALVGLGFSLDALADVEADLGRCRADIVRIGENPRTPAETYCVGLSHQFAINRRRDSARAIEWLRRSAGQGYAPAQAVLGYMLEQGIGAAKNPDEAFRWYQKAAAAGNDDGQFNLGRAYENGIGVARDLARARASYERAAAQGSRVAREALARLRSLQGRKVRRRGEGVPRARGPRLRACTTADRIAIRARRRSSAQCCARGAVVPEVCGAGLRDRPEQSQRRLRVWRGRQ